MSIDLGDVPVGTPPTTSQQIQIREAVQASGYVQHGTIAYLSVDGDDTTAQVNRSDLPFLTAQAALQALFEIRFIELAPYYVDGEEIEMPPPPSTKLIYVGVGEFDGIDLDIVDTTNCPSISFITDLLGNGISISGYNPYTSRLGGISASFEIGLRGDRSVNLGDIVSISVGFVNVVVRDITCTNIMNLVQTTARDISATNNIYLQSDCIIQSAVSDTGTVSGDYTNLVFIGQDWYYEA